MSRGVHSSSWVKHTCSNCGLRGKWKKTSVYLLTTRLSSQVNCRMKPRNKPHTYIGCTNDVLRRLQQHNGRIAGGARYTTRTGREGTWAIRALVEGFCCRRMALKFERKWKDVNKHHYAITSGTSSSGCGVDRVLVKLHKAKTLVGQYHGVACTSSRWRLTIKRFRDQYDIKAGLKPIVLM